MRTHYKQFVLIMGAMLFVVLPTSSVWAARERSGSKAASASKAEDRSQAQTKTTQRASQPSTQKAARSASRASSRSETRQSRQQASAPFTAASPSGSAKDRQHRLNRPHVPRSPLNQRGPRLQPARLLAKRLSRRLRSQRSKEPPRCRRVASTVRLRRSALRKQAIAINRVEFRFLHAVHRHQYLYQREVIARKRLQFPERSRRRHP